MADQGPDKTNRGPLDETEESAAAHPARGTGGSDAEPAADEANATDGTTTDAGGVGAAEDEPIDPLAVLRAELAVVSSFLPSLADEATTRGWVQAAIAESGASSAKELGKVMGALMKAHKGEVDGNLARKLAAELLA